MFSLIVISLVEYNWTPDARKPCWSSSCLPRQFWRNFTLLSTLCNCGATCGITSSTLRRSILNMWYFVCNRLVRCLYFSLLINPFARYLTQRYCWKSHCSFASGKERRCLCIWMSICAYSCFISGAILVVLYEGRCSLLACSKSLKKTFPSESSDIL